MTTRFVAFLRAINVGGRVVTMAELRDHFASLEFGDTQTFLASGNVIFSARSTSSAAMERKIENKLRDVLGYDVPTFVRSAAEVASINAYVAFPTPPFPEVKTSVVGFVAEPLSKEATNALMALQGEHDRFHVRGREIFWASQLPQNESSFSNAVLDRTLKVRSTFRGTNTIVRMVAKHGFEC